MEVSSDFLKLSWCTYGLGLTLISLIVLWVLQVVWVEERKFKHIPGPPKSNLFLGHMLDLKTAMESEDMMIQDLLYQWAKKYGLTYKVFILHKAVVFTANPAGVKEALLGGHPKADELYRQLVNLYGVRFLGNGLVTLTEHGTWDHRRRAMDPAFRRQFLKGLMEQFNSTSDALVAKLQKFTDGKTNVSMLEEFHRISLDIIGKVAFSMDINSIHDDSSPFPSAVKTILQAMYTQLFKGDFGWNPFNRHFYSRAREAVVFLRKVGKDLIESRAEAMALGEDVPDDMLTHSIRLSDGDPVFTIESMLDDFVTFFIAGHETTGNTLSFILLELGRRPDILQRVREEIHAVIGPEKNLKYEHINRLKYLNLVIKESMRLYPTSPSTFRKLNNTCNVGGYMVPQDTIVMVSTYVASRNSEIFDNPLEFLPDRFGPNAEKKIPIYSCFPFSLGPRSCIGKTFAQMQTKVILVKFLMHFDFDLDLTQSFELKEVATLKPKSRVNCLLHKRGDCHSVASSSAEKHEDAFVSDHSSTSDDDEHEHGIKS